VDDNTSTGVQRRSQLRTKLPPLVQKSVIWRCAIDNGEPVPHQSECLRSVWEMHPLGHVRSFRFVALELSGLFSKRCQFKLSRFRFLPSAIDFRMGPVFSCLHVADQIFTFGPRCFLELLQLPPERLPCLLSLGDALHRRVTLPLHLIKLALDLLDQALQLSSSGSREPFRLMGSFGLTA